MTKIRLNAICPLFLFILCGLPSFIQTATLFNCAGDSASQYEGYTFPLAVYLQSNVTFGNFSATLVALDDSTSCLESAYEAIRSNLGPAASIVVWASDNGGCSDGFKLAYATQHGISGVIVSSFREGQTYGPPGREVKRQFERPGPYSLPLWQATITDLPTAYAGVAEANCTVQFYEEYNPWLTEYQLPRWSALRILLLICFGFLIASGILFIIVLALEGKNAIASSRTFNDSTKNRRTSSLNSTTQDRTSSTNDTNEEGGKVKPKQSKRRFVFNVFLTLLLIETASNVFNFVYALDVNSSVGLYTRSAILAVYFISYGLPIMSTLLLAFWWLDMSRERAIIGRGQQSAAKITWMVAYKKYFLIVSGGLIAVGLFESFVVGTYAIGYYDTAARVITELTALGVTIVFNYSIQLCIQDAKKRIKSEISVKRNEDLIRRMTASSVLISIGMYGSVALDLIVLGLPINGYPETSSIYFYVRYICVIVQSCGKIYTSSITKKMQHMCLPKSKVELSTITTTPNIETQQTV